MVRSQLIEITFPLFSLCRTASGIAVVSCTEDKNREPGPKAMPINAANILFPGYMQFFINVFESVQCFIQMLACMSCHQTGSYPGVCLRSQEKNNRFHLVHRYIIYQYYQQTEIAGRYYLFYEGSNIRRQMSVSRDYW